MTNTPHKETQPAAQQAKFFQKAVPLQIQPLGTDQLMIVWADEQISLLPNMLLQLNCRCAKCVDEMTGEILIEESKIDASSQLLEVMRVGNYGVRFRWSKGCESGIYTFDYLQNLASQAK